MGERRLITLLVAVIVQITFHQVFSSHVAGDVKTNCTLDETTAIVTYVGDPKGVVAINKDGEREECVFSENTATVTYTLYIKYKRTSEDDCVFDKTTGMELYTITVQGRNTVAAIQNDGDEEFLIQCSFETYADDVAGGAGVEDPIKSPIIISQNVGDIADSNFTVTVVKINEQPFTKPYVRLGRVIKLRASMTGTANETGFHVSNCKAYSTDMSRSSVLLSEGCGTGFPFHADQGFTLRGLTAISPSFRMFRIKRTQGILFKCSFVICNENCGANSCTPETGVSETESDQTSSNHEERHRRSLETHVNGTTSNFNFLVPFLLGKDAHKKIDAVQRIPGGFILDVSEGKVLSSHTQVKLPKDVQVNRRFTGPKAIVTLASHKVIRLENHRKQSENDNMDTEDSSNNIQIVDNQDETKIGPDDILKEQENGKLNIPEELDISTSMSTPSDIGKNRNFMESSIDMETTSDLEIGKSKTTRKILESSVDKVSVEKVISKDKKIDVSEEASTNKATNIPTNNRLSLGTDNDLIGTDTPSPKTTVSTKQIFYNGEQTVHNNKKVKNIAPNTIQGNMNSSSCIICSSTVVIFMPLLYYIQLFCLF